MSQTPLVSIIIPVYNAERFIIRCLESIENQSFLDYEVILVNDGSKDDSKEIIEKFIGNKCNWFLFSKINEGTAITRNFALKKTRGKFIAFVDVDDFIEKDYLEKLYKSIIESGSNLACCGYNDHSIQGVVSLNNYYGRSSDIISVNEFSKLLFSQIGGVLWDKLFDAEIIRKNYLAMNLNIYYYEDSLFILEYLQFIDTVSIVGDPLYNYNRINETSYTKKIDHTWKDNVINFNREITKKLKHIGFTILERDVIIEKNICVFVFTIFQYKKLYLYSFQEKYKILSNLINDSYIIENFKPKNTVVYYKPFVVFFKYKMIGTIILYSYSLHLLKKIQSSIKN
jgi:glycosyltransferase involved in cell wall biosynthesis